MTILVELPSHLRALANAGPTICVDVQQPVTQRTVLDAVERQYPMLAGTIRDRITGHRRALVRFFAGGADLSHESPDAPLPAAVARREEPFIILGAIAGG